MKKRKAKKTMPQKRNLFYVLAGVLVIIFVSYLSAIRIAQGQQRAKIRESVESFASTLQVKGLSGAEVKEDCSADPGVKFGGPVSCGVLLTYVYISDDPVELKARFEELYAIVGHQDIFSVKKPLARDQTESSSKVSAVANMRVIEKQTNANCSIDFGYGLGFGLYQADSLKLTVLCIY